MSENSPIKASGDKLFDRVASILKQARTNVVKAVNSNMIITYWMIGSEIISEIQQKEDRAAYGKQVIKKLSDELTKKFGKGFSTQNLWNMRLFYQKFSSMQRELKVKSEEMILSALRRELSWTHYKALLRVENTKACIWYMHEAADQNWSTRALQRQINSFYYKRLISSKDKKSVAVEAYEKIADLSTTPEEILKDPYVLEFLQLKDNSNYHESELEKAIVDNIQAFLLELGRGFAFVARQKRISTETKEFYIDLVFYNFHLKCFMLIDLKAGELTHQDVGQMDMYVRMFDDLEKPEDDNPTIGLILCTQKDKTIAKYSVLNESRQLFASKYMMYLPTEKELELELAREKWMIEMQLQEKKGLGGDE